MRRRAERIATRKNTGAVLATVITIEPVLRWFNCPLIGLIFFTRITVTGLRFLNHWLNPAARLSETTMRRKEEVGRTTPKTAEQRVDARLAYRTASTHSTAWRVSSGPVLSLSLRLMLARWASTVFALMPRRLEISFVSFA